MNIFGQNYEEIGSKDKGLILKGNKIKIQWGKKFIDLIDSNGNIKSREFIKSISSSEEIKEDGFYFLDDSLVVKINDTVFELASKSNNTYISFLDDQELNKEQKDKVLKNIGLIYDTLSEENKYPNNGLIYIIDSGTLYKIKNGVLAEYNNPTTKQLIIKKESSDSDGAIVILGEGLENGIIFDNSEIYSKNNDFILNTSNSYNLNINDKKILSINLNKIEGNEFSIIQEDGESTLNIDRITNFSNDVLDSLVLTQESSQTLSINISEINTNSNEGNINVTISSNIMWTVEQSEHISSSDNKGVGTRTIQLSWKQNTSGESINESVKIYDAFYKPLQRIIGLDDDSNILKRHYKIIEFNQQG